MPARWRSARPTKTAPPPGSVATRPTTARLRRARSTYSSNELKRNGRALTWIVRALLCVTLTACGGGQSGSGDGGLPTSAPTPTPTPAPTPTPTPTATPTPTPTPAPTPTSSGCGDGVSTGTGPLISAQQAYVKASNTQALDGFGGALALSGKGNVLVVGARGDWNGGNGFAALTGDPPTSTG